MMVTQKEKLPNRQTILAAAWSELWGHDWIPTCWPPDLHSGQKSAHVRAMERLKGGQNIFMTLFFSWVIGIL